MPAKVMVPEVSFTRPEIARSVVLLPAPLAPSRPTASPSPISMVTLCDRRHRAVAGADARQFEHERLPPPADARRSRDRRGSLPDFPRSPSACLRRSSGRGRARRCGVATAMIARITCSTMTMVSPRCDSFPTSATAWSISAGLSPAMTSSSSSSRGCVASARAISSRRWSMVVRSLAAVLLARGEADELDGLARLLARDSGMLVAQERAGHDVGQHGHGAERFCDLKGAREADARRRHAASGRRSRGRRPSTEPESGR